MHLKTPCSSMAKFGSAEIWTSVCWTGSLKLRLCKVRLFLDALIKSTSAGVWKTI